MITWKEGALAQMARAPALQAGGRRFESGMLHQQLAIGTPGFDSPLSSTNLCVTLLVLLLFL